MGVKLEVISLSYLCFFLPEGQEGTLLNFFGVYVCVSDWTPGLALLGRDSYTELISPVLILLFIFLF